MDMNDYTLEVVRLAELRADAEHVHRAEAARPTARSASAEGPRRNAKWVHDPHGA
jgi:hypothetical protein